MAGRRGFGIWDRAVPLARSPATGGAPGQVAGDRRSTQRAQEKQERKMLDTEYTEHTEKSMKG
jgi:hypothetical protein